jgi:hypothetical protein
MPNLFRHLFADEILKQVQDDTTLTYWGFQLLDFLEFINPENFPASGRYCYLCALKITRYKILE